MYWRRALSNIRTSPWRMTISLLASLAIAWLVWLIVEWAVVNAVWGTDPDASSRCLRAYGKGACWSLIQQKFRFFLFSSFPYDQQWRPAVATIVLAATIAASPIRRSWTRWLPVWWFAVIVGSIALLWGGFPGLPTVSPEEWGGLPITLILSIAVTTLTLPIGVLLALCRQSRRHAILRKVSVAYIEVVRAIPLVSLFFMGIVIFPLIMPRDLQLGQVGRALIVLTAFYSAFVAEAVRGYLEGFDRGQIEAAEALGLPPIRRTLLIVLPQVLTASVPVLIGIFIGLVKDTSLVFLLGVLDILNTAKLATIDPLWQAYTVEALLFAGLLYFTICSALSFIGRTLEEHGRRSRA